MKTKHLTCLVTAALGLVAVPAAVCAEGATKPILAPTKAVITMRVTTPGFATVAFLPTATSYDVTSANWSDIKDNTYDTRAQFFIGFKRLEAKVDAQISELTAKRAAMTSSTDTKDWDFAMKEMGDARSYLHSTGEELAKASPQTWDQLKEKVGQAWVRTQNAYSKVKASTTS